MACNPGGKSEARPRCAAAPLLGRISSIPTRPHQTVGKSCRKSRKLGVLFNFRFKKAIRSLILEIWFVSLFTLCFAPVQFSSVVWCPERGRGQHFDWPLIEPIRTAVRKTRYESRDAFGRIYCDPWRGGAQRHP